MKPEFIFAHWPAPANIHACTSMRAGGVSENQFSSFNLSDYVGDNPAHVAENRARLVETLDLPTEPVWLKQEHGIGVIDAGTAHDKKADAAVCSESGVVCAVLTADCLPLLLCDKRGHHIAAVHVGWRGLAAGIVEAALEAMPSKTSNLLAWMGPCIGRDAWQVGDEVRAALLSKEQQNALAFLPDNDARWKASLRLLVQASLRHSGVSEIYTTADCTYMDSNNFFSHRRDGQTGRMASIIWMQS